MVPRRFKKYVAPPVIPSPSGMAAELDFEIKVLLWLEDELFMELEALEIPPEMWPYYVGYAKRLWERALKFTAGTFNLEATSLHNEYLWRGLDTTIIINWWWIIVLTVNRALSYKQTHVKPCPLLLKSARVRSWYHICPNGPNLGPMANTLSSFYNLSALGISLVAFPSSSYSFLTYQSILRMVVSPTSTYQVNELSGPSAIVAQPTSTYSISEA